VSFWLSTDIDLQMAVEQEKSGSYFSTQDLVLAVYVLYLASFITGFTGIIGVVIAHVKIGSADELSATHFRFQIRTFWCSTCV